MTTRNPIANTEQHESVSARPTRMPPVDVYESDDELLLVADMPGADREEMAVDVERGLLTLRGPRAWKAAGEPLGDELGEFEWERAFRLPRDLDTDSVRAEYDAGVLRIHLPKAPEVRPRRIQVQ
ncbi:MAG: Hsp20/alpha crystallin family protein [Myxococcota bacterium]